MSNDQDYDDDGNNIVPCPICLNVHCASKEDGKCPEEDEFAKAMTTPETMRGLIHTHLQKAKHIFEDRFVEVRAEEDGNSLWKKKSNPDEIPKLLETIIVNAVNDCDAHHKALRAKELGEISEVQRLSHRKKSNQSHYSWSVGYYKKKIKEAQRDIDFYSGKLTELTEKKP